ncbi:ATP-binding protein [Streptomyces sp. NA04227]|uniref:ATP-binding protein n=1 Tax=Streptomyces sp. NA04227 TaxID=2742136 RepID=UPI0015920BF7|nr:ATP-binding protein [Streptomyces sp. NA04227]QKW07501.1 ATP-binding protein [Streptomyces sp. NA04227]
MSANRTTPTGAVADQRPVALREFIRRFPSTPRGARTARCAAVRQLHDWGVPFGSEMCDTAAVIVAELAANAVTHGRVPSRSFELRLGISVHSLWIEVSDTRSERRPPAPGDVPVPDPLAESGRGLFLVETLADRWCVLKRNAVGKTVRAELDLRR